MQYVSSQHPRLIRNGGRFLDSRNICRYVILQSMFSGRRIVRLESWSNFANGSLQGLLAGLQLGAGSL